MKKFLYVFFTLVLSAPLAFSQGEVEALKFSREDLYGTARAMGMGGAFGALGGDQTGISINPAGIGVYRSSEIAGTFGISGEMSKVGSESKSVTNPNFSNLGFVGYFPLRSNVMPMINFGFTFNRQKSFDKKIYGTGAPNNTLIDYMVDRTNSFDNGAGVHPDWLYIPTQNENLPDPFNSDVPWLTILGYNSYLINPIKINAQGHFTPMNTGQEQAISQIISDESGYTDNYDFTVGTTLGNVLNIGVGLTVSEMRYLLKSDYMEDFNRGGYTLTNSLGVTGAGIGAKFGVIYRPTQAVRLGLAYHTPKWYTFTEEYEAQIVDDVSAYSNSEGIGKTTSARFANDYNLRTSDKWVASAAVVLGQHFIASVDYELADYRNLKLSVPRNPNASKDQQEIDKHWYDMDNEYIRTDYKMASTIKIGMEYRFTPQFSGRLGYAWMQNPYETKFRNEGNAAIFNSNTIFRMEGDTNYFTGGLGYRFNRNFYADLAVVYRTQTDDLYAFPNVYNEAINELIVSSKPFSLKNTCISGLVTLGYKF